MSLKQCFAVDGLKTVFCCTTNTDTETKLLNASQHAHRNHLWVRLWPNCNRHQILRPSRLLTHNVMPRTSSSPFVSQKQVSRQLSLSKHCCSSDQICAFMATTHLPVKTWMTRSQTRFREQGWWLLWPPKLTANAPECHAALMERWVWFAPDRSLTSWSRCVTTLFTRTPQWCSPSLLSTRNGSHPATCQMIWSRRYWIAWTNCVGRFGFYPFQLFKRLDQSWFWNRWCVCTDLNKRYQPDCCSRGYFLFSLLSRLRLYFLTPLCSRIS